MIITGLLLMVLAGLTGYWFGKRDGKQAYDDELLAHYEIKITS